MTKWAPALFSRTPSTDYRWLALPADIANDPVDRKRAVGLSSDIPHRGNDRPRMWVVRSDGKHVWFGTWGEVSRIFGDVRDGVRISRAGSDPTDHRENIAFAGYVTKRSDFAGLPPFSPDETHPAFVQAHADHLLELWGEKGREVGDHSPVVATTYSTELPIGGAARLPEGWEAKLREAEQRIRQGHSFQLNCFEGRQAEFVEPRPAAQQVAGMRETVSPHPLPSPRPGIYEALEEGGRFPSSWWSELPPIGKVTIGVGAVVAAAAVIAATLAHASEQPRGNGHQGLQSPDRIGIGEITHAGRILSSNQSSIRL